MKRMFINLARQLRKNQTEAEALMWRHLRGRRFFNIKFKRQFSMFGYIVDFVSLEAKIIIELDGGQHVIDWFKDSKRDKVLRKEGYKVFRFWNNEVLRNIYGVLEVLQSDIPPHPNPSPQGEKGVKVMTGK